MLDRREFALTARQERQSAWWPLAMARSSQPQFLVPVLLTRWLRALRLSHAGSPLPVSHSDKSSSWQPAELRPVPAGFSSAAGGICGPGQIAAKNSIACAATPGGILIRWRAGPRCPLAGRRRVLPQAYPAVRRWPTTASAPARAGRPPGGSAGSRCPPGQQRTSAAA